MPLFHPPDQLAERGDRGSGPKQSRVHASGTGGANVCPELTTVTVPSASTAAIPTDVLMRVRIDLAGKNLYLQLYATRNHEVIGETSGVFGGASDIIYGPGDVQTIEARQR